ncbi:MAG: MFS transporter [Deltaproteobacteria bacterium]|nr:MFS transporter [Deltaproteobacteria bacterium]
MKNVKKAMILILVFSFSFLRYKTYVKRKRLAIIFGILSVAFTLSQFYRVSSAVIAPSLILELKLDAKSLGILGSAFFYSFALLQIPMGILLDRFGPRIVMSIFPAIAAIGAFVFAVSHQFKTLLLGRLLLGVGMSAALMGSLKVFVIAFPSDRFATFSGLLLSFGTLGNILASSPLAYLDLVIGWRFAFIVLAIITFIVSVALWIALGGLNENAGGTFIHPKPKDTFLAICKNLSFWQVGSLAFFRYGTFVAMQGLWFGPYLVHIKGFTPILAGNIIMMLSFGVIVGSTLAGYITDRVLKSPKKGVIIGVSLYALSILFFTGVLDIKSPFSFFLIFFLVGLFNSFGILVYSHIRNLFPSQVSGTVMSSVNFFTMAGGAFFMQVMGDLIHLFREKDGLYPPNAYHAAFFFCFLGVCFSLLFYGFSRTELKESFLSGNSNFRSGRGDHD